MVLSVIELFALALFIGAIGTLLVRARYVRALADQRSAAQSQVAAVEGKHVEEVSRLERAWQVSLRLAEGAAKGDECAELLELERTHRLIKLDYPCIPRRREWDPTASKIFGMMRARRDGYRQVLTGMAALAPFFEKIPVHGVEGEPLRPRWDNGWFPPLDAISLYGLLALRNPRWYVETGSGNSTMFARQAIKDHGLRTQIISIDPFPRADIDQICDRAIRQPFEDVASEFFASLSGEDVFFVDNSHRAFPNSDVTVFFLEVLPKLPKGIVFGLHDITLPVDYPNSWNDRFYNEQYLLATYLLGGAASDEILLPNTYLSYFDPELLGLLGPILDNPNLEGIGRTGVAFWMQRQ